LKDALHYVYDNKSLVCCAPQYNGTIGISTDESKTRGINFVYGVQDKWAQIIYLSAADIKIYKELCEVNSKYLDFEIYNQIINKGSVFYIVRILHHIMDVDSTKDLEIAKKEFSEYPFSI